MSAVDKSGRPAAGNSSAEAGVRVRGDQVDPGHLHAARPLLQEGLALPGPYGASTVEKRATEKETVGHSA